MSTVEEEGKVFPWCGKGMAGLFPMTVVLIPFRYRSLQHTLRACLFLSVNPAQCSNPPFQSDLQISAVLVEDEGEYTCYRGDAVLNYYLEVSGDSICIHGMPAIYARALSISTWRKFVSLHKTSGNEVFIQHSRQRLLYYVYGNAMS